MDSKARRQAPRARRYPGHVAPLTFGCKGLTRGKGGPTGRWAIFRLRIPRSAPRPKIWVHLLPLKKPSPLLYDPYPKHSARRTVASEPRRLPVVQAQVALSSASLEGAFLTQRLTTTPTVGMVRRFLPGRN